MGREIERRNGSGPDLLARLFARRTQQVGDRPGPFRANTGSGGERVPTQGTRQPPQSNLKISLCLLRKGGVYSLKNKEPAVALGLVSWTESMNLGISQKLRTTGWCLDRSVKT